MSSYVLSGKAAADIETIALASLKKWGRDRARSYMEALHATLGVLAAFPDIGQSVDQLPPGIMKMPTGSHLIFYRKRQSDIRIVRVLHRRMDVSRHL